MLAWFQSSREVAFLLTVVGAATMALTNRYFATASNFDSLQTILAVNGMLALGMMVLLIAGFFDLSVGSTMGLAGIVCAMLLHAHLPIPLAVAAERIRWEPSPRIASIDWTCKGRNSSQPRSQTASWIFGSSLQNEKLIIPPQLRHR